MLNPKNSLKKVTGKIILLYAFISFVIFQPIVFAESTNKKAVEIRNKGYAAQTQNDYLQAFAYYKEALSLGLKDAMIYNDLGVLSEKIGFYGDAERYYLKAMSLDNTYLPAYSNIAYLYKSQGVSEKAFEYFKKRYLLSDPSDPWAEKAREEMLAIHPDYASQLKQFDVMLLEKSITQRRKAKENEKFRRSYYHYSKGQEYFRQKKYEKALAEFDSALAITPDHPMIMTARQRAAIRLNKY